MVGRQLRLGGAFHGIRVEPADAERREAGDGGKPRPEREPAWSSGGAGRAGAAEGAGGAGASSAGSCSRIARWSYVIRRKQAERSPDEVERVAERSKQVAANA
jgi:hypothetical protein